MFDSSKIYSLTKEDLLRKVSNYEMLKYYIPGNGNKYQISCHFHKDKRPSMVVNLSKGNWTCYSCGRHGDGIDYVIQKYNVNFTEALKIISNDFGLFTHNYNKKSLDLFGISKDIKTSTTIKIKAKEFTVKDYDYWNKYNITKEICKIFDVYSISHYFINNKVFGCINQTFAYNIADRFKIYQPFSKTNKWYSNLKRDDIFGFKQLKYESDILIITKSLKDIMVLYSLGIESIAPQGESILIDEETINYLKTKYKKIYTLFDYDNSGIHLSWLMRKLYETKPLFFTNKIWSRKIGYKNCKDISDFIINNKKELSEIIQKLKNKYN
jgi:DNA primase